MAEGDKPYRVYKGGRTKGKVPVATRPGRSRDGARVDRQPPTRRPRWGRRIGLAVLLVVVLMIVWLVASYLAFRSGVEDANARLPKTVEANLSRAYRKLGIHSRAELGRWYAERREQGEQRER